MGHVYFAPGKSLHGNIDLSFSKGFTVAAFLQINPQDTADQQTIFRFDDDIREVAELFVAEDGSLVFGAGDASVTIQSDQFKIYANKPVAVLFSCRITHGKIVIELEIDNTIKENGSYDQAIEPQPKTSIWGGGAADFLVFEKADFQGAMSDDEREKIVRYFKARHQS